MLVPAAKGASNWPDDDPGRASIPSAPQVTAAVGLFNGRDFVLDCLESVSARTVPGWILIVVDDGSQDGGADEVRKWLEIPSRALCTNTSDPTRNSPGIAASRNAAFAAARSDYVFVLDGDNLIYPRCLQQLAAVLDRTAASFSYCYLETLGAEIGLRNLDEWQPAMLQSGNPIEGMVMMRSRVWQNIGGYTPTCPNPGGKTSTCGSGSRESTGGALGYRSARALSRAHEADGRGVPAPRMHDMREYFRERHPHAFGIPETRSGR